MRLIMVHGMDVVAGTGEEKLPGYGPEFPYVATRAELSAYPNELVPWHWHGAAELFYVETGYVRCETPGGAMEFEQGSIGFIMANELHRTTWEHGSVQLLHLFSPSFLFGSAETRLYRKYVLPLTMRGALGPIRPDARTSALVREAFEVDDTRPDWEYELRERLCRIWFGILASVPEGTQAQDVSATLCKELVLYFEQHYAEEINAQSAADAAGVSLRTCYRLFAQNLHTTPADYLQVCRLRHACELLAGTDRTVTEIIGLCGFGGSSSYFARVFARMMHCTPLQYRRTRLAENHPNEAETE